MITKHYTAKQLIQLRRQRKMDVPEFWAQVGMPEAVGLLYEEGNTMPPWAAIMVEMVHELDISVGSPDVRLYLSKCCHRVQGVMELAALQELTPVSEWTPCGLSSLPNIRVQTDSGAAMSKAIFFETSDGDIYHGQYCEDETGDYPKYFIADLYDEVILIGDVKRWMYVPS